MKLDDEGLREIYQDYVASRRPTHREDCPSIETIVNSFESRASRRNKKRVIDHLSECPNCREDFELLFRLENGRSVENLPGSRSPIFFPLWRFASLIIGFGLIISALLLFFRTREIPDTERGGSSNVVLSYPVTSHFLSDKLVFRWEEFPSTQYYIVELFDEALLPIWVSPPIYATQTRLPPGINGKIKPRTSYYWMVTGFYGTARTGESTLAQFTVHDR